MTVSRPNSSVRLFRLFAVTATTVLCTSFAGAQSLPIASDAPLTDNANQSVKQDRDQLSPTAEHDLLFGGCGGVYFLAEPGELVIDVYKRDLNRRGRTTELRALLVSPDRQVLEEVTLETDNQPRGSGEGPLQQVRLQTEVDQRGIFALSVTISQDPHGEEVVWGFETNCPHYLIETSRGHRDQRREEPIVLRGSNRNSDRKGCICFLPRQESFAMELSGLLPNAHPLLLKNCDGNRLASFQADDQGRAKYVVSEDVPREKTPWTVELPSQRGTLHIDGVTRWKVGELYENLPYWTPHPDSFFPLAQYRWLLTPYRRVVYGRPGEPVKVDFEVHNNGPGTANVLLSAIPTSPVEPISLSATRVEVPSRRAASVTLSGTIPANDDTVVQLRATPVDHPNFSTYSTVTLRPGPAPASAPIKLPLTLSPYEHENEQFGYLPDYPVDNQMYFDVTNHPMVTLSDRIAAWTGQYWHTTQLGDAIVSPQWTGNALSLVTTKVAFDADNDLYAIGRSGGDHWLLHSTDHGQTFSAAKIPGGRGKSVTFDIEQFSGHNLPTGPPPLIRYTRTASDPRLKWRRINDLELFLPRKTEGQIDIGQPILLSRACIGLSSHSGIPSSIVSGRDKSGNEKVHVAWGEATDPAEKVPGVPTYVVTIDRRTNQMGTRSLVGYGPPANDIHNSPSITIDSQGYLHVLVGTHGQPFPYCRSRHPHDTLAGWTDPVPVGDGRQTYIGLVCGADDTLHLVCRLWRNGVEPHPLSIHATLAYQQKPPGEPWKEPRVLIVSPFSEYSIFYHRLTIDRIGRLFLSYDYWSTYWFYRTDHRGDRRALMLSADRGQTWKLAESSDWAF